MKGTAKWDISYGKVVVALGCVRPMTGGSTGLTDGVCTKRITESRCVHAISSAGLVSPSPSMDGQILRQEPAVW